MIESGQVWTSGGRSVRVLAKSETQITVRDSYGWRRSLTEEELTRGFTDLSRQVESTRGVMARRTLPDLEPA